MARFGLWLMIAGLAVVFALPLMAAAADGRDPAALTRDDPQVNHVHSLSGAAAVPAPGPFLPG